MAKTKDTWETLCPACAQPVSHDSSNCPGCGQQIQGIEDLLKKAEGKYGRDAKIRRLKQELRQSWAYLLLILIAQFLMIGPGAIAIFLIRTSSILDEAIGYYVFAGYWLLSLAAGIALIKLHTRIERILSEQNKEE